MRVAILGGGGFRTPLLVGALRGSGAVLDDVALYDVAPDRLAVMASVLGPDVRTTTDLDLALDGADVVFAAVRVGGLDGRVGDERTALDLGVLGQETVGAGGLRYALRTLPVADDLARHIAARAPQAWTISMTNPAGMVTRVMSRHLGARVIGVCDSPIGLIRRACAALGVDPGPSLATFAASVRPDYLGLNHLGWLRALHVDGVDRLPELLADPVALGRTEEGRLFGADVLRAIGSVPNEYLYWYYAQHEALAGVQQAGRTRGEHVRREQHAFYAAAAADPATAAQRWTAANDERNRSYFAELREGERDDADVAAGGYESVAVALAAALTGGTATRLVLNVGNHGLVTALAPDAVVETVCLVDAGGAHPEPVAPPAAHELGLMSSVHAGESAITEAALTGSYDAALRAFTLHPLVGSLDAARALAADR